MIERKYPNPRPVAVDLFCGAGGMSLGFEQAGFQIALGIDADGHHVAAHERNFPYGKVACMSVVDVTAKKIRELSGIEGEIDLLFGGPPCQGFSNMGHRDKDDPRNTLVDEFARIVLDLRPKAFVMENVPAMLSGDTRHILDRVICDLEAGGYRITKPIEKLVASDFGVPQHRTRLFVLGVREDVADTIAYPERANPGQPERPTVFEAIADLPAVEKHEDLYHHDIARYDQPAVTRYARVARGEEEDPSDLSIPRDWDRMVCSGNLRVRHSQSSINLYAATPPGTAVPGHKLPRLDPHGLSPTLRAGSDSTRGSYTAPRPIHPYLPRCITAREAARLHGYPDWFSFFPTKWHAYKQIGNSVCPPVARAIGYQVAKVLKLRKSGKSPKPVKLSNDFHLPIDRPRQHKRIPQLRHYPPVIADLFERSFDVKNGTIKRIKFSFADVLASIKHVGADLHWTRSETFLDEIARSRNVKKILEAPLKFGYSIRRIEGNKNWIGEFVSAKMPGCIEQKEELGAKAKDLSNVIEIHCPATMLSDLPRNVGNLLNDKDVRSRIWPASVTKIEAETDYLPFVEVAGCALRVIEAGGKVGRSYAMLGSNSNVPTTSRVVRAGLQQNASEVIAMTPVTGKHLLVSRFTLRESLPIEQERFIFALNGQH